MKIIISENQLNNVSLNKNWLLDRVQTSSKKIIVTESQYSKLLLKESTKAKNPWVADNPNVSGGESSGWSTLNGTKSNKNSYGDFRVGGDLVHVKYLCGWYNDECTHCQPTNSWGWNPGDVGGNYTGKGTYPSESMEKFVKLLWKLGKRKASNDTIKRTKGKSSFKTKYNADLIYREGINEYKRLVAEGKINRTKNLSSSDLEGEKSEQWSADDWNNSLQGLTKLGYQLNPNGNERGAFPRMCSEGSYETDWGHLGTFIEWVSTWNAQDWIDAAALVAFAIGTVFPPAALVGVGLELVNVGISSYNLSQGEGSWADVGLRTLFVFGGPLIGRGIGYGLRLGQKVAAKLFKIAVDAIKWAGRKAGLIPAKEIGEYILSKGLSKAETKVVEQWIKEIQSNPKAFKDNLKQMEDLIQKAAKGDEAAIKQLKVLREKAISKGLPSSNSLNPLSKVKDKVVKGVNGKTYKVNAYWEEFLNPFGSGLSAKIGVGLASTIFIGLKGMEFAAWLESQKLQEKMGKELQNKLLEFDGVKDTIKKMRKENLNVSRDATLQEIVLEYSTKVSDEEFGKTVTELQSEMDNALTIFKNKYQEGASHIRNLRKQTGKLYKTFNSFCESIPNYPNTLDQVTVTTKRTPKQKREMRKIVKDKGIKFKNYRFVFDDKFNGIYEKDGGEWVNIVSKCNNSEKIISDFCKSGDKNAKVFCNNVNLDSISLDEFNEIFIENIEIGEIQTWMDLFPL